MPYRKLILFLFTLSFLYACNTTKEEDAKTIVSKTIETHGGAAYEDMDVSFDFRKFSLRLRQNASQFIYERFSTDSMGNTVHDSLYNNGFSRMLNDTIASLSEKETDKIKNSVNATAYFVLLPYKLSEPAVKLKYLGKKEIGEDQFFKIGVSFDEKGGGKDFEDHFCYWVNTKTHTMDYLAYASGGPRLRKVNGRDTVAGIIFQNYDNYQVLDSISEPQNYDDAYISGKIKLLSVIKNENYKNNKLVNLK